MYYDITPDVRLTLGLRETYDQKSYQPAMPVLGVPGAGLRLQPVQNLNNWATTGRAILSWTPHLSFTDHTMLYASYSRGYKAGGFNPPCSSQCGYPTHSEPEYDNAFEIGTKNTLDGGRLTLNLAGFYDIYQGYQVANIVAKTSINQNINANIYGLEFQSVWNPVDHLTFDANIGWLHTEITGGQIMDQENLTQGDPNLVVLKSADGSNCVVNATGLANLLHATSGLFPGFQQSVITGSPFPGGAKGICGGQYGYAAPYFGLAGPPKPGAHAFGTPASDPYGLYNYSGSPNVVLFNGVGQGVAADIKGNRLPNAPDWTISVGAQYVWELPADWTATLRGDYYWQGASYARIFNDAVDYLRPWDNLNATLTFASLPLGLDVQFYVKNAFNSQPITDTAISDAAAGLLVNTFTLDPRTFGVAVSKKF
jgi:outer membrane receptor protein involved in Fe transport